MVKLWFFVLLFVLLSAGIQAQTITWTGAGGNNQWYFPQNWDQMRVPNQFDDVYATGGEVSGGMVYVRSLHVGPGGLSLLNGVQVTITSDLLIDSNAYFGGDFNILTAGGNIVINGQFNAATMSAPEIHCGGDFIPRTSASFIPGLSTVIFSATFGYFSGQFHNIQFINGGERHTNGNVYVGGVCQIDDDIYLRPADTLFVQDTASSALYGNGNVVDGAVSRAVSQGSTDSYRFESNSTFVQFDGTGTYPAGILLRTHPNEPAATCFDVWRPLSGTVNASQNTITMQNVQRFGRWAIGILHSTEPVINRYYEMQANGTGTFNCKISLRYDTPEIPGGTHEDSLVILRSDAISPAISNAVGWNLLSIPTLKNSCNLSGAPDLALVAAASGTQAAPGLERLSDTVQVHPGWNMVGALSKPILASALITVPPGLINSFFFAYEGSYAAADSLEPGKGYWVKINSPGGLLILNAVGGE